MIPHPGYRVPGLKATYVVNPRVILISAGRERSRHREGLKLNTSVVAGCPSEQTPEAPTSVHMLRPGDVAVVSSAPYSTTLRTHGMNRR